MHSEDQYHSAKNYHHDSERPCHAALRKGRYSIPHHAYFLTKCVNERDSTVLSLPACATIVIETLEWLVAHRYARCCGFVVMPDHYHVVLGLYETKTLEQVVASLNRYTSRQINLLLKRTGRFWEAAYYDHAIRNRQDFDEILVYMHENPVCAGLVERAKDWVYSSANPNYAHLIDWDWLGPSLW